MQVYQKYIIGVVVAILLVIGANIYIGKKEDAAYHRGFDEANTAWIKKGGEYVAIIDQQYKDNNDLNQKLQKLSDEKRALEEDKIRKVGSKQLEYNSSSAARNKGLDDGFIDLYNDSLGE